MTAPRKVLPDQVPDELIEIAGEAHRTAPQKRDGQPTRMRYAVAAVLTALAQPDGPLAQLLAQQDGPLAEPDTPQAEERPWPGPRITLLPNGRGPGVHQLLADGQDISRAVRRAVLRMEPGCWPRLDLELRVYEHGGIDATGAEVVLPPETVQALQALGWVPPGQPARPDTARS